MLSLLALAASAAADAHFYGLAILPLNTAYPQADVGYLQDGQLAVNSSSQVYMSVYDDSTATINGLAVGVSSDGFPNFDTTVGTTGWAVRTLDIPSYPSATIAIYNGVFQFWLCDNSHGQSYAQGGSQFPLAVGRSAPAGCANPLAVYLQANDYTDYFNSLSAQYAAASTTIDFSISLTGTYSASTTESGVNALALQTDSAPLTTNTTAVSLSTSPGTMAASSTHSSAHAESHSSESSAHAESHSSESSNHSQSNTLSTNTTVAANAAAQLGWPAIMALGLCL